MAEENDSITYYLSRTAKKNVNIVIKDDGLVHVSAPRYVSIDEINKIVYSKKDWIIKTQKNLKTKKIVHSNSIIESGAIIYFYGNPYVLKIIPSVSNSIKTDGNEFLFYVKKEHLNAQNYLRNELNKNLKKELTKTVTKCIQNYLELTSLSLDSIDVRVMKSRWGTCIPSKKKIIMNFNLIYCPMESIEYVALHEVTHLMHPNHSKRFYESIAMYMPDWKERKNLLKNYAIL